MSEFMQTELPPVSTAATLDEATSLAAQLVVVTDAALQLEAILHCMTEENDMSLRSDLQERREKALAIIHSAQGIAHPDTKRLDHLIQMDHSVVGPAEAGNPATVESIHFIFDGVTGNNIIKDRVRAAIDLSIATLRQRTSAPRFVFITGSTSYLKDTERRYYAVHDTTKTPTEQP